MNRRALIVWLLGMASSGCGGSSEPIGSIHLIRSEDTTANRELFVSVAKQFYASHRDEYDMLVLWGAPEFSPGSSFYLPVRNDVPGIGYEHLGPDSFDLGSDYGSTRLEGITWLGSDWMHAGSEGGARSVLGVVAHETGHRWSCLVHFQDSKAGPSDALLGDGMHWSFFLDTGADPMGGNRWRPLDGSLYQAEPVDQVEFCPLNLYLMGLVPAESVPPLKLLVNMRDENDRPIGGISPYSKRVSEPLTLKADTKEISVDQIIAAEGRRDVDVGFSARTIRQAWIYVYHDFNGASSAAEITALQSLRSRWDAYFSDATGGRSAMDSASP